MVSRLAPFGVTSRLRITAAERAAAAVAVAEAFSRPIPAEPGMVVPADDATVSFRQRRRPGFMTRRAARMTA